MPMLLEALLLGIQKDAVTCLENLQSVCGNNSDITKYLDKIICWNWIPTKYLAMHQFQNSVFEIQNFLTICNQMV